MDDTGTDQDKQASDGEATDEQAADAESTDEQAADAESTDEQASDDTSTDEKGPPDKDDADARLDDLGDRIQSVRSDAEEVVEGVADTEDKKFTESGDDQSKGEDDQTIAPG